MHNTDQQHPVIDLTAITERNHLSALAGIGIDQLIEEASALGIFSLRRESDGMFMATITFNHARSVIIAKSDIFAMAYDAIADVIDTAYKLGAVEE